MKKIIEETDQHTIFIDYFEGSPIQFIQFSLFMTNSEMS